MGQSYRMSVDLDQRIVRLSIRTPDSQGKWERSWRERTMTLPSPEPVIQRLKEGSALAPTLREVHEADGSRYAVLDFIVTVPTPPECRWDQMQDVLRFD
jgi:hypothetical protein